MREIVNYTENQINEMKKFYQHCLKTPEIFDDYGNLCDKAEKFKDTIEDSCCNISLLAFYALVEYRNNIPNYENKKQFKDVVVRNFDRTDAVRLNKEICDMLEWIASEELCDPKV
jgi:hypothetical protein